MQSPNPRSRRSLAYQTAVLGVSALVILFVTSTTIRAFQAAVAQPGAVALGVSAVGQVVGAASPRGPAAETLPGLVGTPTPSATATRTPTRTSTPTPTPTFSPTPTLTPDVRVYDPARAATLLAQAQTSWAAEAAPFQANVTLAADRLNGTRLAPGATLSFNGVAGPYTLANGYQAITIGKTDPLTRTVPTIEGGITQVSTTLFQAAFWAGLKIVERSTHPVWLDRFNAGSTGQRGLDAYVSSTGEDLKLTNTTPDWIRIETAVQPGSLTVSIYGADPGWSVNPSISGPSRVVQPNATPVVQLDPSLPPGQQMTISVGIAGFDLTVQRTVTKAGQVVDRYGVSQRYQPQPAVIATGPPPPTPTPPPPVPTPVPQPGSPSGPTHLAGLNPSAFVLPDGRIKVPTLVGLPEAEAQQVITAVGLQTTYVNYQGPSDVPPAALNAVHVGEVLSQTPAPETAVPRGTTIYIAVRKQ